MALLNSQPVPGLLRGGILATDTGNGGYPLPRYKYLSPLQLSIELLATETVCLVFDSIFARLVVYYQVVIGVIDVGWSLGVRIVDQNRGFNVMFYRYCYYVRNM